MSLDDPWVIIERVFRWEGEEMTKFSDESLYNGWVFGRRLGSRPRSVFGPRFFYRKRIAERVLLFFEGKKLIL